MCEIYTIEFLINVVRFIKKINTYQYVYILIIFGYDCLLGLTLYISLQKQIVLRYLILNLTSLIETRMCVISICLIKVGN